MRDKLSSLGVLFVLLLVIVAVATPALGLAVISPDAAIPNPAALMIVASGSIMVLVHQFALRSRR